MSTAGRRSAGAVLGVPHGGPADLFVSELTVRIGTSGVRAGPIKVAGGFHATGAPVAVHLELGTGAPDVLDLLCGELGVPPDRVVLSHLNRSPDPVTHRHVAEARRLVGLRRPSHADHARDWRMPDAVRALAEAGFGDRHEPPPPSTERAAAVVVSPPSRTTRPAPSRWSGTPGRRPGAPRGQEHRMALEMRDHYERGTATELPLEAPARICSYECTLCVPCTEAMAGVCPNCGGELVTRPRRTVGPLD
ncbi:DUF1272 domain-containing protein [Streptomyces sp. NPDC018693]|uniref:DUF1272 domain-containing protein n=1 Tax=unclassified Streptomyces TaxID=2593676 RepID=UPI0037A41D5A